MDKARGNTRFYIRVDEHEASSALSMKGNAFRDANLSFRGSATQDRPHNKTRRATEKSTLGVLVGCRSAPDPAPSSCVATVSPARLPRQAS